MFMKLLLQHPLICSEQNDLEAGTDLQVKQAINDWACSS
ncbi:hypothetical protein NC652_031840 [Populus alba x Populus x berolinensis]|uniref:Uncharacterized protein n=1 Tax=Populus alba x Populus x berolinensis TaxID=444605 RepID=A0AAD6Q3Q6_9ROSI|nr:hypothetical protein NC652_031840 [Populus alba x Populus x berolinensis]KAJ6975893.1 hypothetical protein NC653_031653 [Populus alba x Populus x berolinensis]